MEPAAQKDKPLCFLRKYRGELLCLLLPALLFLFWNLRHHCLVNLSPDGLLYFSIADNFLTTGHFIQTARPYDNFVVPFGLPLVLTVLRLCRLSTEAIVLLQYFLPGVGCIFLLHAERRLLGWGFFAPVFYIVALLRIPINPNNAYVELYYLPILAWLLDTSLRRDLPEKKKLTRLNIGGFLALVFRPVLVVVYAFILIYTLFRLCRRAVSPGRFALLLLIPALLLGANTLVNYRETGYPIVMSSYSGRDVYLANNKDTHPVFYKTNELYKFVGDEYYEIMDKYSPDIKLQSDALQELARQWVRENFSTFLSFTARRFREDFVWIWRYALVACFLSALAFFRFAPERRTWLLVTLLLNLTVAVITAMGIIVPRYTLPVWPLAALHLALPGHGCFRLAGRLLHRQSADRKTEIK